jgi:hypothetical protein
MKFGLAFPARAALSPGLVCSVPSFATLAFLALSFERAVCIQLTPEFPLVQLFLVKERL